MRSKQVNRSIVINTTWLIIIISSSIKLFSDIEKVLFEHHLLTNNHVEAIKNYTVNYFYISIQLTDHTTSIINYPLILGLCMILFNTVEAVCAYVNFRRRMKSKHGSINAK